MRQVKMTLLDPGGAIEVACQARDYWADGKNEGCWVVVYVDQLGQVQTTKSRLDLAREGGSFLGRLRLRVKTNTVAIHGVFLADMADELIDAFAEVGMQAICVMPKQ